MIDPTAPSACLHEDTLVHTSRGLIAARDIRSGETIFSLDGATSQIRPAHVLEVGEAVPRELIQVKVGTRTIRVTPDQAFLALVDRRRPGRQRRRFRREWTSADQLRIGDIVAVARKTPDLGAVQRLAMPSRVRDRRARAVRFPFEADPDLMWWSGLYVGDGYIHHTGNSRRVEFAIPASQPDLRIELGAVTKRLFAVEARAPDDWRVVIPGVRIFDFVQAIGLGGTALEKRVPRWVFDSPEPHRLAFLGGYIDADGLVRTGRSKDMGATSANRALLEDVRQLAVTCGVRTSRVWTFTSRHPNDRTRIMTGYRMQFSGDFDRISCRAMQRRERMRQRRWFHNDTSVGGTKLTPHVSEWLGFAKVEAVARSGLAPTCRVAVGGSRTIVAESLIIHAS